MRQPDVENPLPTTIPGCGEKCTIEQFYEVYKELIPGTFEDECELNGSDKPNSAAINGNCCILSSVMYIFWFICTLIYLKLSV